MHSLINLIMVVDLLLLPVIYIPFAAQATPGQSAPIKQSALLGKPLIGPDCLIYPFAARQTAVDNATPGVTVIDILEGPGSTDRGWLAWDPTWHNVYDLSAELQNPQLSLSDYTNPLDFNDHILDVGDYVTSLPGNNNGAVLEIDTLVGQELIIPVWDNFTNSPIAAYHVSSFARVRIDSSDDISLVTSNPQVLATYLGVVALEQCTYLTLTKSGPLTATVNSLITYTLALTNSGNQTATNVVITDVIPVNATYGSGGTPVSNMVSWTVLSLPFGSSLSRTFSVTASQTITNDDYGVSADGDISATGTVSVVTSIPIFENVMAWIYLLVIVKD